MVLSMKFKKPCLVCGGLSYGERCEPHEKEYQRQRELKKDRSHYKGNYQSRSRKVRQGAIVCWICNDGARTNDPWTADHVFPGVAESPLLPAHRSCNSRRGNRL